MPSSESVLIQKAKSGDRRAFGELVHLYRDRILALGYDLMGNYEDASDLAQEAFVRAFQRLGSFEERARFSTWLYRITVNLAMDTHRKKKRRPTDSFETRFRDGEPAAALEESVQIAPDNGLERADTRRLIEDALAQLTDHQRTATTLRYFHQMSCGEIASVMGCAEGTVRIHLHRAMRHLRQILKKSDFFGEDNS